MQKTFTIENMETYFLNYIPCQEHRKEPITNFCTERVCLKFLCPECVENHSLVHANHSIDSIKTCIKKTSEKLRETVKELEGEIGRNSFLRPQHTQQFTKTLIRELDEVRKGLIEEINSYFRQKQTQIRKQTSKYHLIQTKLQNLKKQLGLATSELKMLDKHLYYTNESVKAIKKANSIDYKAMINHFKLEIDDLQDELNFNIKLEMDNVKRQQLRNNLNNLIGIKNRVDGSKAKSRLKASKNVAASRNVTPARYILEEQTHFGNRQGYIINPPPLSADRMLNQGSFRIDAPDYFNGEPFLHFFQASRPNLHIMRINDIREGRPIEWHVIPLTGVQSIPSFHRTVATEDGNIFLIGGTITQTLKKSKAIYQFDPINNKLVQCSQLLIGRSSHSAICHGRQIYIVGGMAENDETLKKCEIFNPQTRETKYITPSKYATTNSCVCAVGKENIIKLGGVFSSGENNDHIEIYNITANFWGEVDPTIENVKGQFGLLSCSGWAPLNDTQIFIFGGYNEQSQNQNSKMSFVLEHNKAQNQYYIKYVNMKNPPIAQGFWNPQGIVHKGIIYSLQNADGQENNECLEDKRTLLIFNGKTWSSPYEQ